MSWHDIGSKIKAAREAAQLSQAELATSVGLDRTAVTKIESGQRKIDSLELARLAEALERPIVWFVSPALPSVVSRRASRYMTVGSPADLLLENAAHDISLLIKLRLLPLDQGTGQVRPRGAADSVATAERAAMDLRRQLGLENEPIWDLPRAVEQVGLYAFSLDLGDELLDGSYLAVGDAGVALVNGGAPSGRRRFSLAHELGHHLFADQYSDEWIIDIGEDRERLINAFAAHFLAPRDGVRSRWGRLNGAEDPRGAALEIGHEYGLSWSAVCAHLCNLGCIDEAIRLKTEQARPRKVEYVERSLPQREDLVPPAIPPRFAAAVVKAYRSNRLSAARAVTMLRGTVSEDELPPLDTVPLEAMAGELELA